MLAACPGLKGSCNVASDHTCIHSVVILKFLYPKAPLIEGRSVPGDTILQSHFPRHPPQLGGRAKINQKYEETGFFAHSSNWTLRMAYPLEGIPLRNTFWKCMGMFSLSL